MPKEIARTGEVDNDVLARTPKISSFRCQLAKSVVTLDRSCAIIHAEVER